MFKSAVLERTYDVPTHLTAPIVVAERLTDVIAVVVLILLGSTSLPGGFTWALLGAMCRRGGPRVHLLGRADVVAARQATDHQVVGPGSQVARSVHPAATHQQPSFAFGAHTFELCGLGL